MKGWKGDSKRHAEIGRLGGLATAATQNADFYKTIGKKGGQVSPGNFAHNKERAILAGKKGATTRWKKESEAATNF